MKHIDIQPYDQWHEHVIEDFCDNICPHFGLDVNYSDVQFSGFWSQGDGASFTGDFSLYDVSPAELKASLPTEVELHQLVDRLYVFAEDHPTIEGTITRLSSRYSHSNTMLIGEFTSDLDYCTVEADDFLPYQGEVLQIFRQLADWLYSRLSNEYDFQLAYATASQWAEAIEERNAVQADLTQLQVDIALNPPQSKIQAAALTASIAALEVEFESLTSKIDQLSDQFSYWPKDGGPYNIGQFYENFC